MVEGLSLALALAGTFAVPRAGRSRRVPGSELESNPDIRFLRGLRERGYWTSRLEYTQTLLKAPATPAALKPVLTYEVGRGLLEEATRSADLEKRFALLEQARARLDEVTKNYHHELTPEALVQLARLYVERGHTAMLQAQEPQGRGGRGRGQVEGGRRRAGVEARRRPPRRLRRGPQGVRVGRGSNQEAQYESYPAFSSPRGTRSARSRRGSMSP